MHMSGRVPEWWVDVALPDASKLTHWPEWLDQHWHEIQKPFRQGTPPIPKRAEKVTGLASVREMVLCGESGGVALGRRLDDISRILGEPTDWSVRPRIVQYGPLELTFRDGRVVLAACYLSRNRHDDRVDIDVPLTLPAAEDWLRSENITFSPDPALTYDDQTALKVDKSRAHLLFEENDLWSVQIA